MPFILQILRDSFLLSFNTLGRESSPVLNLGGTHAGGKRGGIYLLQLSVGLRVEWSNSDLTCSRSSRCSPDNRTTLELAKFDLACDILLCSWTSRERHIRRSVIYLHACGRMVPGEFSGGKLTTCCRGEPEKKLNI